MATLTHSRPFFAAVQDWVLTTKTAYAHRRAQRAEARRVYNELSALSERELTDIGISRFNIRDIATEAGRMV